MKPWYLLPFSLLLSAEAALGAACCGGGIAAPAMIAGDDRAQLTSSYSFTEVAVDSVDSRGIWRKWEHHQRVETFRVEGAHLLSDRWQAGFSLPVIRRSRLEQTYTGLGDVSATLAYEYLPDWDYHPIRPKGTGFLQLSFPTGKARAESDVGGLDSRGNGFLSVGLGTLLTKAMGPYDLFTLAEIHRSMPKDVANTSVKGTLRPGYGGTLTLGAGYNFWAWRIGPSLSWTYEDPVELRGDVSSSGTLERYTTAALALSYLPSDAWAGTLTYSDQTLFGSPLNTSLGRSFALQVQRRWGR